MSSNKTCFNVESGQISFTADTYQWALLVKIMSKLDIDQIQDDSERLCLELWRQGVRNAVWAALALGWVSTNKDLMEDIMHYLM